MKTWENAEMQELNIYETAKGGKSFTAIDDNYFDNNGFAISSYEKEES